MALKCLLYALRTFICPYPYINCQCDFLDDKSALSACDELPIVCYAFGRDNHVCAGRVVPELNVRLAVLVSPEIGVPVKCAAEVVHRRHLLIIFRLEHFYGVKALIRCIAYALNLALYSGFGEAVHQIWGSPFDGR